MLSGINSRSEVNLPDKTTQGELRKSPLLSAGRQAKQ